eukprot:Sspe_Gene.12885::Locus_4420_Transcript_1_1_Confidence_1.000_Length_11390::g.12885::m.12885/K19525/VPS13A_C; vacuolar protein sorting-associated protein 13A/C
MNRIVAPIVAKYTDQYIEGLDATNLQLSVFSGSIELQNLSLRREALAELNLPIDVVRGTLGKLVIKIPWTSLSKNAVEVKIDELFLLAKPKQFGKRVSFVRFTPVKVRNQKADRLSIGSFELLDEHGKSLPLSRVKPVSGKTDPQWDPIDDSGAWREGAPYTDSSKKGIVLQMQKTSTIRGYRMKTSARSADEDPVGWVVEGALTAHGPWTELHKMTNESSVVKEREKWTDVFWVGEKDKKKSIEQNKKEFVDSRKQTLSQYDEFLKSVSEAAGDHDAKEATFVERLQETIVNNIQIDIRNIHIRLEDDVTNPKNVYTFGVTLESLHVCSCTADWERTFVTEVGKKLHKIASLNNLGVYMDHARILTHDLETAEWKEMMLLGITRRHSFLLNPLSLEARLAMLSRKGKKDPSMRDPGIAASVECTSLGLSMLRPQFVSLLEVLQFMQNYSRLAKYNLFRPEVPVKKDVRAWWGYAKSCVIRTIREQRKPTEKTFSGKKKVQAEYIELFKKSQKVPWMPKLAEGSKEEKRIKALLDIYQYNLPLDELKKYHQIAHQELMAGKALYEKKQREHKEKMKEKKKKQSWGAWLYGAKVEDEGEESAYQSELLNIDENAREQLKESIGWDEDAEPASEISKGKDYVQTAFDLQVGGFNIGLGESRRSPVADMSLSQLGMRLELREGGSSTYLKVKDFVLKDIDPSSKNVHKKVIGVREEEEEETDDKALLGIEYHSPPLDGRADQACKVVGKGLDVWFAPLWLSKIVGLVQVPPTVNLSSLEAATTVALADLGSGATRSLMLALEERTTIALEVDFAAPRLYVPLDASVDSGVQSLFVDLGQFRMNSEVDNEKKKRAQDGASSLTEKDYYDTFHLELQGVHTSIFTLGDSSSHRAILDDLSFNFLFHNCLVDNKDLASQKLEGDIPDLHLHVSPQMVIDFMTNLEVVLAWVRDPSGLITADEDGGDDDTVATRWRDKVEVLAPRYVSPDDNKEEGDEKWEEYMATFIPQYYKLILEPVAEDRKPSDTVVVKVGQHTVCDMVGAALRLRLPQDKAEKGAYIELSIAGDDVETLASHVSKAVWAIKDWTSQREAKRALMGKGGETQEEENSDKKVSDSKVTMLCNLGLKELKLSLHNDQKNEVANVAMQNLRVKYKMRPKDSVADLTMKSLFLGDMLREMDDKVLVGLLGGKEEDTHGAQLVYTMASEGTPMEFRKKDRVGSKLQLNCHQLLLNMERTTIPNILGYLSSYGQKMAALGSNAPVVYEETKIAEVVEEKKGWFDTKKVSKESDEEHIAGSMLIETHAWQLATSFWNTGHQIFSTTAAETSIRIRNNPLDSLDVKATLGDFTLQHHSEDNVHYKQLVASKKKGSTLDVIYWQSYRDDQGEKGVPHHSAKCTVSLGGSRIVYLQRTIAQLQRYFDVGYLMKEMPSAHVSAASEAAQGAAKAAQQMAAKAAAKRGESLSLMQFDVKVNEPSLILPYSVSSPNYAQLVIGDVVFRTELKKKDHGAWVELMDVKVLDTSILIKDDKLEAIKGGNTSIISHWTFDCLGERRVVKGQTGEAIPGMVLTSTIGDMEVHLSKAQYDALMNILASNVLDDWLDSEMAVVLSQDTAATEDGADGEEGDDEESGKEQKDENKAKDEPADPNELSLVFNLDFQKLRVGLDLDKQGGKWLEKQQPFVEAYLRKLKISHKSRNSGDQETQIWLEGIGVEDKRDTQSLLREIVVFGKGGEDGKERKPLVDRTASAKESKLLVDLPEATATLVPEVVGGLAQFFTVTDSDNEMVKREEALRRKMRESEEEGDKWIGAETWSNLNADLFLGPSHRLIVRAEQGGRVVLDGQGQHSLYLTGKCHTTDLVQPPPDDQKFCIVVHKETTLVIRNITIYSINPIEDYIKPGSGRVVVDRGSCKVECAATKTLKAPAPEGDMVSKMEVSFMEGIKVRIPEDVNNKHARMLVAIVGGTMVMSSGENGPGSSCMTVDTKNLTVFPTTTSGRDKQEELQIHNVLGPVELRLVMLGEVDKSKDTLLRNIAVLGKNCNIRIAYHDLQTVLKFWNSFSEAMWGSGEQEKAKPLYLYAPTTNAFSSGLGVQTQQQQHSSEDGDVKMQLDVFSILIVDDQVGYDQDLLRFTFPAKDKGMFAIDWKLSLSGESVEGSLGVVMALDYLNPSNAEWEPIIERYDGRLDLAKKPTASAVVTSELSVSFTASNKLEINMSNAMLSRLMSVSSQWSAGLFETSSVEGLGEKFTSRYVLENQTGFALDVLGAFGRKAGDEDSKITVKGTPHGFNLHNDSDGVATVSIDFGPYGLRPFRFLASSENQLCEIPRPLLDQNERYLYATVRQRGGQTVMTLTSRFLVRNCCSEDLEFQIQVPGSKPAIVPLPAAEGGNEVSIPMWGLSHIRDCKIRVRPANGGYHWSTQGGNQFLHVASSSPQSGNLMCGRADDMSSLPQNFNLQFTRVIHSSAATLKSGNMHVIELRSPVLLENLLPCPIEASLLYDPKGADKATVSLQAGESSEIFSVNMDNPVYVAYLLFNPETGQNLTRSAPQLLCKPDMTLANSEKPRVRLHDRSARDRVLHLVLNTVLVNTKRSVVEASVYAPYWVVNMTPLKKLMIRDGDGSPIAEGLPNAGEGEHPPPLLLSASNPDDPFSGKIRVGLGGNCMSDKFPHDAVGVAGEAKFREGDKEHRLGVQVELATGKFLRTKIIKLTHAWSVINRSEYTLALRHAGTSGKEWTRCLLPQEEDCTFPFPASPERENAMELSIHGHAEWDGVWSPWFLITDLGTKYVNLTHPKTGITRVFDCRIIQKNSVSFLVIENATTPPFKIVNHTFLPAQLVQKMKKVTVQPFSIEPFYPYTDSGAKQKKAPQVDLSIGTLRKTVELRIQDEEVTSPDGDVVVRVELGLDCLVLFLEHCSMRVDINPDWQLPWLHAKVATSIGVSFINGNGADRYEIAYLHLGGLELKYTQKTSMLDIGLTLEELQFDNQMANAIFPVLLTSHARAMQTEKQKREGKNTQHTLSVSLVDYSTEAGGMTTFGHFDFLLQELTLSIDDTFLMSLKDYFGTVFNVSSDATDNKIEITYPKFDPATDTVAEDRQFYADEMLLNPIKLNLTFQSEENFEGSDNLLLVLLNTVFMAVKNIENASLQLHAFLLQPAHGTQGEILSAITQHYIRSGLKEAYKVVGALEFLGNPIGLIGNLGSGFHDLWYEPVHGITKSPEAFAKGVARGASSMTRHTTYGVFNMVSGITSSMSKGVATLSLDEDYLKERRKRQRMKAQNLQQGVTQGAHALGRGVFDGITGIVTKPIEGARENSILGFGSGVAKGIIGVPVKVVSGVLDGVGKVTEGAKGQVAGGSDAFAKRKRPPRCLVNGVLIPYSHEYACSQDLIMKAGFVQDRILKLTWHTESENKQLCTVYTNHRIVAFKVKKERKAEMTWQALWVVNYNKLRDISVDSERGYHVKLEDDKGVRMTSVDSRDVLESVVKLLTQKVPHVPLRQRLFNNISGTESGCVEVWENERRYPPFISWTKSLLPSDRPAWSDIDGKEERQRRNYPNPPEGCVWLGEWKVDTSEQFGKDGWQYAQEFTFDFHHTERFDRVVRRRRWYRDYGVDEAAAQPSEKRELDMSMSMASEMSEGSMSVSQNPVTSTGSVLQRHFDHVQADEKAETTEVVEVFENQRSYPFVGFTSKLLPTDRPAWSDRSGKHNRTKESMERDLPEGWKWVGDWQIERGSHTDKNGWQFAVDFPFEFHSREKPLYSVRRRRWTRTKMQL